MLPLPSVGFLCPLQCIEMSRQDMDSCITCAQSHTHILVHPSARGLGVEEREACRQEWDSEQHSHPLKGSSERNPVWLPPPCLATRPRFCFFPAYTFASVSLQPSPFHNLLSLLERERGGERERICIKNGSFLSEKQDKLASHHCGVNIKGKQRGKIHVSVYVCVCACAYGRATVHVFIEHQELQRTQKNEHFAKVIFVSGSKLYWNLSLGMWVSKSSNGVRAREERKSEEMWKQRE